MRTGGCRAHSRRSSPQVRGAGSGTEAQLRVSWDGVLNAERTGRWWIVGSAWTGAPMIDSSRQKVPQKQLAGTVCGRMLMRPVCCAGPAASPDGLPQSSHPGAWQVLAP